MYYHLHHSSLSSTYTNIKPKDVPVRIKWSNDIYYRDRVKLGGILVSCFSFGSNTTLTAVVGKCALNSEPT